MLSATKISPKQTSLFTEEELMYSQVASHAKMPAMPSRQDRGNKVSKENEQDYSGKCLGPPKKLNPTTLLPKTWLIFLKLTKGEILARYSPNYPHWGIMQNGEFVERQKSVRPIIGQGCIWLLTPTASEYKEIKVFFPYYLSRLKRSAGRLREQMWRLTQEELGWVNPRFIAWMMGFPLDWTLLENPSKPSETP